ncbi:MAG: TIR domain-containing protein [Steroidobacteraceae bacterium]
MPEANKAIFLSYASQDIEPARRICDALRAAGLEVWFDQSELRGGDAWDAAIRQQVKECALFVPLISASTNARSEGYFRREWNLAVHRMLDMADDQAFLLPVVIDDTPEPAARVPDRFRERQWTRLPKGAMAAGFVERVTRLLGGQPALPVATPVAAQPSAPAAGAARGEDSFWVAVLPFKCAGANADLTALAEGLSEEIVTGLSRFSYLRVISRSSTSRYAGQAIDVRTVGKEIGARYVMEGSLRQAGTQLRVTVQLVDAGTGAHLWAETYERPFRPEDLFALQDDLVPRIVSTVADMHGVLPRSMSDAVRNKAADQLTPYEALLHSFGYNERWTMEALAESRTCLERAVQQDPRNGDCWAMLSLMYSNEFGHWDIRDPASFEKALRAARTAVLSAPLHSLPHYALAQALFFRREFPAARTAAERAVSLNPLDAATAAFMGLLIAYSGDWPRGCELAERGLKLNPNLPGMYNYTAWHDAYGRKDYRRALELALKLNTPDNFYQHAVLAMCYAQLGKMDAAHKSLQEMLALKPDYGKVARLLHGKWIQPELVEQLMDGLRKAGLEIAAEDDASAALPESSKSSEPTLVPARGDEGFWVAVLPFKYRGTDSALTALAEGLAEDIVTGLSRFSYLRVISRSSTLRFTDAAFDVRAAGKDLGARYVLEGSLRQAGTQLRVTVQLVDAVTGAHLWAETYERAFSPESAFVTQDELVPRIVATIADVHGILPRSMSAVLRTRDPAELTPYEAVLRSFTYSERVTADELAAALSGLELAVKRAPANGDAWAMLAWLCLQDHAQGFGVQPDSLARGLAAARRAVEAAPSNHLAHFGLAQAFYFRKEFESFRNAAERAVALNPMDGYSIAFVGELLTYTGDWKRGLELAGRAKQLNPHHPGWYWYADFYHAHLQGDFRGAIANLLRANMPGHWGFHAGLAACHAQLGERDAAGKALLELLRLRPDFAATVRAEFAKWWSPEYVELFIDGLRKAGLTVPPADAPAEPTLHA